ncbi:zinc ribbon domain-containing protein [Tetragenococcus halophilus]
MYCNQCGKEINKEVSFCPFCGADQRQKSAGKPEAVEGEKTNVETSEENIEKGPSSSIEDDEQNNAEESKKMKTEINSVGKETESISGEKTNDKSRGSNKEENNRNWDSWRALLGPLYYFQEGLWKKGLLLLSAIFLASSVLFNMFPQTSFLWIFLILYIAVFEYMPRKDIERKKQNDEIMWKELPPFFNKDIVAIVAIVVSVLVLFISIDSAGRSRLEKNAEPVVTDILQDNYGLDYTCNDVNITEEYDNNNYRAAATLDDNSVVHVNIETYSGSRDNFNVQIPYEEVYLL